ncbi:MAG TPA: glycosyltransferase family 39 protein, partial [Chloroflexota bacterium]|nr:glycosyltransferase family 39 protein [Chloroflexota bacterium]
GAPWPLVFESFGDFKRPLYIYTAIPSVAIFGLTPLGVRLPSALAATLSVPVLYLVARLLLRGRRPALLAAGMLAVSPWHLQFSRAAREVSLLVLALLILVAALLALVHVRPQAAPHHQSPTARARPGRGPRRSLGRGGGPGGPLLGLMYPLAALALLGAMYAYHSGVIVAPLLTLLILWVYRARLRCLWRHGGVPRLWLGAALVVLVAGGLPLLQQFVDGPARTRFAITSVFANPQLRAVSEARMGRDVRDGAPWVLDHPLVLGTWRAVGAYLTHFEPSYLFTRGDAEWRHHSSTGGQLHLWDAPLLLAGLGVAVRRWRRPAVQVVVGWLALGALPAAFATPAPHALRTIAMLPAWYLLAGLGLPPLWRWLVRRRVTRDWALALLLSVGVYLYGYYRYYGYEHDDAWSSGWLETFRVAQAEVDAGRFSRVVIPADLPTPRVGYIYALFGTAYDPAAYLAQGGTSTSRRWPWYPEPGPLAFRPFEVRVVEWEEEARRPDTLYVHPPGRRLPDGTRRRGRDQAHRWQRSGRPAAHRLRLTRAQHSSGR